MGLAWGIAYQLSRSLMLKYRQSLKNFNLLFIGTFISAWVGAKIFFLIHSAGGEFSYYMGAGKFWLGGGFVFYGGLVFGAIFVIILTKIFKLFEYKYLHLTLPGLAIGHGVGRIGCLLAGCCYGTVCKLPWSLYVHGDFRHPVQLYEAVSLFVLGFILFKLIRLKKPASFIIGSYFISYTVIRFVLEFFRGDKIRGVYFFGLSTSQVISIILVIIVLGALATGKLKKRL